MNDYEKRKAERLIQTACDALYEASKLVGEYINASARNNYKDEPGFSTVAVISNSKIVHSAEKWDGLVDVRGMLDGERALREEED